MLCLHQQYTRPQNSAEAQFLLGQEGHCGKTVVAICESHFVCQTVRLQQKLPATARWVPRHVSTNVQQHTSGKMLSGNNSTATHLIPALCPYAPLGGTVVAYLEAYLERTWHVRQLQAVCNLLRQVRSHGPAAIGYLNTLGSLHTPSPRIFGFCSVATFRKGNSS